LGSLGYRLGGCAGPPLLASSFGVIEITAN